MCIRDSVFAEGGERPLLLIGTDCPALNVEHLRQAALALHLSLIHI